MDTRLLSVDPITGEEEWFHYDPITDTSYVEQRFDCQDIVDDATRIRNATFGFSRTQLARPLADIPNTLVFQWLKEGFNLYQCSKQELDRKLADYPKLKLAPKRTNPGIIITGVR